MARRIIPKLCLSTILIEVGIICALVAVNSRPISYADLGSDESDLQYQKAHARDLVQYNNNLQGQDDDDYTHPPHILGGEYGWPWTFLQSNTEKGISNFKAGPFAANLATCWTIVVCTTIIIESSIQLAQRKLKLKSVTEYEN